MHAAARLIAVDVDHLRLELGVDDLLSVYSPL